jgi:hypothetical protein
MILTSLALAFLGAAVLSDAEKRSIRHRAMLGRWDLVRMRLGNDRYRAFVLSLPSGPERQRATIELERPLIEAQIWSDDEHYVITFDAEPWFVRSSDENILGLALQGWRGDYEADAVAIELEDENPDIRKVIRYCEETHRGHGAASSPIGFEVAVDSSDVVAWAKHHKPHLYDQLVREHEEQRSDVK